MPATSEKQKRFMDAAAHNPKFAKAAGVPVSVAKDFSEKSKGQKFGSGGSKTRADVQSINNPKTNHGASGFFSKGGDMKKMNMGGYADGGLNMVNKGNKMVPDFASDGVGKMKKGGMAKGKMPAALAKHAGMPASKAHKGLKTGGMASSKMGSVKTSATRDGVASKGKTKGTMVKMNMGGKAC
jgi:hypothetical protein